MQYIYHVKLISVLSLGKIDKFTDHRVTDQCVILRSEPRKYIIVSLV